MRKFLLIVESDYSSLFRYLACNRILKFFFESEEWKFPDAETLHYW